MAKQKSKTLALLIKPPTAQAKYLQGRGFSGREEYLSYLYQGKCREARQLRAALKKFIATVAKIKTPRDVAIGKRKRP